MKLSRGFFVAGIVVTLLTTLPALASAQDVEGSRDHPLFSRLPDYYTDKYQEFDLDVYDCVGPAESPRGGPAGAGHFEPIQRRSDQEQKGRTGGALGI